MRWNYRSILVAFTIQPLGVFSYATGINDANVCTSARCQDYAKFLKESMAPNYESIDPCTNFDKYSCDGWTSKHNWRDDQTSVSVTTVMVDQNHNLIHAILEGDYAENTTFTGADKTSDQKNFINLKKLYNSCKNEDAIKAYGVAPLKKIIAELDTLFPGNRSGSLSVEELSKTMSWLAKNAVSGIASAAPSADDMNPDTMIISLGASEMQLAKAYYNKSLVLTNYTRAVAQMLHVMDTEKSIEDSPIPSSRNATLFEKAERIVNFEKLIAQNTPEPEVGQDVTYYYKLKTLGELASMVPEVSWTQYLSDLAPSGYTLDSKRTVIAGDIDFFGNLSRIIKTTPRETLHDYFEWRLISTYSGRIHRNYSAPLRRFTNVMVGKDPDSTAERWRICVQDIDDHLSHLIGAAFIQRAFTAKDKALGDQLINDVKGVFAENLKGITWMSDDAKKVAASKVERMTSKVGYQTKNPSETKPQELFEWYSDMKTSDNFFDNFIYGIDWTTRKSWAKLLKSTDRDEWTMTSATVNAYNNPPLNEIVFPAGIMQIPNFSGDLPDYVSYGAFGATVGHEMTHGFDDNGSKYDASGRYRAWWDNSTTSQFDKQAECFVKQYGQYTVEGLEGEKVPVNGKLTLGENIADAGGINNAYRAWKKRETNSGAPNQGLPGLEKFTNDQLFYISYGNSWCEKIRKEALLKQVLSDAHSPADKRILGPLENAADFKRVFNCPVKEAKCALW